VVHTCGELATVADIAAPPFSASKPLHSLKLLFTKSDIELPRQCPAVNNQNTTRTWISPQFVRVQSAPTRDSGPDTTTYSHYILLYNKNEYAQRRGIGCRVPFPRRPAIHPPETVGGDAGDSIRCAPPAVHERQRVQALTSTARHNVCPPPPTSRYIVPTHPLEPSGGGGATAQPLASVAIVRVCTMPPLVWRYCKMFFHRISCARINRRNRRNRPHGDNNGRPRRRRARGACAAYMRSSLPCMRPVCAAAAAALSLLLSRHSPEATARRDRGRGERRVSVPLPPSVGVWQRVTLTPLDSCIRHSSTAAAR
jgi:hypothetical protein